MDEYQENKFLDNEQAYLKIYAEDENEVIIDQSHNIDQENVEAYHQDTFVKEKNSILNNIYDLVVEAAKKHDIAPETVFTTAEEAKRLSTLVSKIKSS